MDDLLAFPVAHPIPNTLLPSTEAGVGMGSRPYSHSTFPG